MITKQDSGYFHIIMQTENVSNVSKESHNRILDILDEASENMKTVIMLYLIGVKIPTIIDITKVAQAPLLKVTQNLRRWRGKYWPMLYEMDLRKEKRVLEDILDHLRKTLPAEEKKWNSMERDRIARELDQKKIEKLAYDMLPESEKNKKNKKEEEKPAVTEIRMSEPRKTIDQIKRDEKIRKLAESVPRDVQKKFVKLINNDGRDIIRQHVMKKKKKEKEDADKDKKNE